jgi:hypothetical protein
MKPRNLKSNDQEQIKLEKYFAEKLQWFYERKEGAWSAYKSDHRRWSTINQRPQDFMTGKVVRKVDNEEIAQSWLAFIGFSEQAVDQKRYLFAPDKPFYDLIFNHRTARHGESYKHRFADPAVLQEATQQTPAGDGLLVSYIVSEFAKGVVKTRRENRDDAVARLRIEGRSRAEQDKHLTEDREYLQGMLLRSMLFLFVEFFGYLMLDAYGKLVHQKSPKLLRNGSIGEVWKTGDITKVRQDFYERKYADNDILPVAWELYRHCVSQMVDNRSWLRERQQAPNVSKFTYSAKTRDPLFDELRATGEILERRGLNRVWSQPLNEAKSTKAYIQNAID